ncbi:MAG: 7,8-didemethyl-8-hydroxy-5-deazariboflavin synthase CofG [Candidatus Eremiobacteraeota bacterium]|nr:7,8-didemethyl-8-hydroxy-5-deazariboflavin synthase CofG [Candidatus Eremiobacteraeota bacterium]MCW5867411.1 7,8-didemethyl-8-hydroxy-5-deazariboflavin synthase CofG [Candidatus Eremiobacteraeota bacterium]
MNASDALRLLQTPLTELDSLLQAAGEARDRRSGKRLTYSPKVFLPVTNLCRDKCAYCTFRKSPREAGAKTMTLDEIKEVSAQGVHLRCSEALMCLGDRPEAVYPTYQEHLRRMGVETTAEYVYEACVVALNQGLLPHTNAGLLTKTEMEHLRPVNVSMGLMLEQITPRLRERGMAHAGAPDKEPALRIQMLEEAGQLKIPFTTGILAGIGETLEEQIDTLLEIDRIHKRYGHLQEVIVQTFRAKPDIVMRDHLEMEDWELVRLVAVARLLLPDMNVQAPPNLTPLAHRLLIRAGINDWGGISPVTQDFINPEAPWPHIESLRQTCALEGFRLEARLPVYAEYLDWVDPGLALSVQKNAERIAHVAA